MKNLISRTIIGLLLLIVTAWVFISGPDLALLIYFLAISSCALYELQKAVQANAGDNFLLYLPYIHNFCFLLACWMKNEAWIVDTWLIYSMILLLYFLFNGKKNLLDIAQPALLSLYITLFSGQAFLLPRTSQANGLIMVLSIAWGCDTFAYLVGLFLGKRPLTKISPNKTVEGSLGGLGGALLISLILKPFVFSSLPISKIILMALPGAVIAQCGDLLASRIKRTGQIKDYSHLLGPHGGIMDRFDSFFLVLPFVRIFFSLWL